MAIKKWIETHPLILHSFIYFVILISLAFLAKEIRRVALENRAVACATADLISHVPAVQFAGEPLENFLGWIRARHDILVAAKDAQTCSPEIILGLEERIRLDQQLLEEIKEQRE